MIYSNPGDYYLPSTYKIGNCGYSVFYQYVANNDAIRK